MESLDTWAGIVLWLRNTLINWAVFLPLLIGVAAMAVAYLAGAELFGMAPLPKTLDWHALVAGPAVLALLCLGVAVFLTCIWLPSHYFPDAAGTDAAETQTEAFGAGWTKIRNFILLPVWAWVFLAPLAVVPILHVPDSVLPPAQALIAPAPPPQPCAPAAPPQCPLSIHVPGVTPIPNSDPWWFAALLPRAISKAIGGLVSFWPKHWSMPVPARLMGEIQERSRKFSILSRGHRRRKGGAPNRLQRANLPTSSLLRVGIPSGFL